jgi:hypothetical protein
MCGCEVLMHMDAPCGTVQRQSTSCQQATVCRWRDACTRHYVHVQSILLIQPQGHEAARVDVGVWMAGGMRTCDCLTHSHPTSRSSEAYVWMRM